MAQSPPKHPMSKEMADSMIGEIRDVFPKAEPPEGIREPSLPEEHIAQWPAGHKRDEEERRRRDELEERAEQATNLGEGDVLSAIDEHKLHHQDNEIMQHVREQPEDFSEFEQLGNGVGSCPVTNPTPGYRYLWVPQWDHGGSEKVLAHLQNVRYTITRLGYERVEGNMPECLDMKAIGGVRRWGDCVLYRIKTEQYEKLGRYREELLRRQGAMADSMFERHYEANYAARVGRSGLAHSDPRDPMVQMMVIARGGAQYVMEQREIRSGRVVPGRWR